jgi:hypothetical protein
MTTSAGSLFRPALFEKLPQGRFVASIIALLPLHSVSVSCGRLLLVKARRAFRILKERCTKDPL